MKASNCLLMVVLVISSFLMGCVPNLYNYYSPEAEGGIIKKSMCGGEIGPKDMIEFYRDNVTISIKADEINDGIKVNVVIIIPKDNKVQFKSSIVKVYMPSNGNIFEGSLTPLGYITDKSWKSGVIITGETKEHRPRYGKIWTSDKRFDMSATIKMPKAEMIKLEFPLFYINKKQVNLPKIILKKDKCLGMYPLNC